MFYAVVDHIVLIKFWSKTCCAYGPVATRLTNTGKFILQKSNLGRKNERHMYYLQRYERRLWTRI